VFFVWATLLMVAFMTGGVSGRQGRFFGKKRYVPKPLPAFQSARGKLPTPPGRARLRCVVTARFT